MGLPKRISRDFQVPALWITCGKALQDVGMSKHKILWLGIFKKISLALHFVLLLRNGKEYKYLKNKT